jgi:hypothetical protein
VVLLETRGDVRRFGVLDARKLSMSGDVMPSEPAGDPIYEVWDARFDQKSAYSFWMICQS